MPHDIMIVRCFSDDTLSAFPVEIETYPFVKQGDFAIASDTGRVYVCNSITPSVVWTWLGNPNIASPAWGGIDGTLSSQTDLNNALGGKAESTHAHNPSDITGTAVITNDSRLSDARTPTTHTHSYEPANSNIQTHIGSTHAPSNAQKNSDIIKSEIEAVLTGAITSHSHAGGADPVYTVLSSGTLAMAFGTNDVVKITPSATQTFTTTVPAAGKTKTLIILTSGTVSRTITFGTGFKPVGTLATGTTSGRVFVIHYVSDGTNLYEAGRTAAMVA